MVGDEGSAIRSQCEIGGLVEGAVDPTHCRIGAEDDDAALVGVEHVQLVAPDLEGDAASWQLILRQG